MPSKSEYEKLRSDNIERNEAFLQSICIADTKKRLSRDDTRSEHKSSRLKRHKLAANSEPFIPRRSSRSNKDLIIEDDAPVVQPPPVDKRIKSLANLLLTDEEYEEVSTSQFLSSLSESSSVSEVIKSETSTSSDGQYEQNLRALFASPGSHREEDRDNTTVKMKMETAGEEEYKVVHKDRSREDISKVTKTRMTELLFHPCIHKTVVIGGDHTGHVGIWDATTATATTTTTHFLTRPHTAPVSGLHVHASQPNTLWSVSVDKAIRRSDIEQDQFVEAYRSDTPIRYHPPPTTCSIGNN
jgi:WD repeat-containing protein 76